MPALAAPHPSGASQSPASPAGRGTSTGPGVGPTAWAAFTLVALLGLPWSHFAPSLKIAGFGLPAALASVSGWIMLVALAASSAVDIRTRRIPNKYTYPAVVWLLLLALLNEYVGAARLGLGDTSLAVLPAFESLAGAVVCFAVMFFVFLCGAGGGGDVKLAAVLGACLGPTTGIMAIAVTHVAAGAVGLAWGVWSLGPVAVLRTLWRFFGSYLLPMWVLPPDEEDKKFLKLPLPLSPFFFLGAVVAAWGVL
jgi:Flp pilus assembly protein protease CpaA